MYLRNDMEWNSGDDPYYPINDSENSELYNKYKKLTKAEKNTIFGGRLGEYKYYDMDKVIEVDLDKVKEIFEESEILLKSL